MKRIISPKYIIHLALKTVFRLVNMSKKQARRREKQASSASPTGGSGKSNRTSGSKFGHDYSKDYNDPNWPYAKGKMDKGAWFLVICVPMAIAMLLGYFWYQNHLREMVRTPLDAPRIISGTSAAENPHRFWGTYRSGVYFGLKTRSPRSPVVGLMWLTQFTEEMPPAIRHWCEQGDGIPMYGWFAHDGANFGIQEILDKYYTLSTDFVKRPGGQHGGDWSARIHVKPRPGAEKAVMSLFFYIALDGQGSLEAEVQKNRLTAVRGFSEELGTFRLSFPKPAQNLKKSNYMVTHAKGLHQLKEAMMEGFRMQTWDKEKNMPYLGLGGRLMPRDVENPSENYMIHQVTVQLPFEMEILFESGSFIDRPNTFSGPVYQKQMQYSLEEFDKKFEDTFKLEAKGFAKNEIGFAKASLSNMLGGMGYFYGSSIVASKYTKKGPLQYWEAPLFTAVPSRSFFPRGFLWDEGFHNLLISKWDQELSMEIIGHWLDLMNTEGWIPREQILGYEARAKVPEEFVVQKNENANPPTLFLPLQNIVKSLIGSKEQKDQIYLRHLYPRLKAWYSWFNTTQVGILPFTYYWKGRNAQTKHELNPQTLSSGLDDYPRASHPTAHERHVDLRCWMALASGIMADIAKSLGEPYQEYQATYDLLTDNRLLDELHWSEEGQQYSDYGLHTDHAKLERPKPKAPQPGQRPPPPGEKERVVKQEPEIGFVKQYGYVSLFPFLLHIVEPTSPKLGKILQDMQDTNLLWTKFGLRSLARSSPLYDKYNTEHNPPYWRGYIWININYLAVRALHHYSNIDGPYRETAASLYKELRENLVSNMMSQYIKTGYVWENYDDKSGQGRGSHPFTGWSALVVAIMAEEY